jgi:hypothetical protein
MPVTFVNRSVSSPLLVPLSSGMTLRLPPGGSSEKLPDREAENNPKVDKLRRQGLLEVITEPRSSSRKKDAPETSGKQAPETSGKK